MIDFAIITTPREQTTLNNSINSLRYAGFGDVIHLFTEPGNYIIRDEGINLIQNKEQLGCFKNFDKALNYLVKHSNKEYVCVLSDDFIYKKSIFKYIESFWRKYPHAGYCALFTPLGLSQFATKAGWFTINRGYEVSWGGLYVMKREVAKQVIEHEFYQNHLKNYTKNQQIDHCLPEVFYQLGLDQFYHNPSLTDHIGHKSTIGHKHTHHSRGLKFSIN